MTLLHVIRTDGTYSSEPYTGPLKYKCPPWGKLEELVGCSGVEHVNVLWKGRAAHMFVDDVGLFKYLPQNKRASRIYGNNTIARTLQTLHSPLIYNDLTQNPVPDRGDWQFPWDQFMIAGTAVLWEGEME